MVPTVEFPPAMPFTLQLTVVSVVLVTVAANVNWLPSTTEPLDGATLTVMEGGGGGGGVTAPPPPQPSVPAPAARRPRKLARDFRELSMPFCGRAACFAQKQGKGQRK